MRTVLGRSGGLAVAGLLVVGTAVGLGAPPALALDSQTVVVQGGTTPTDSGLLQAVIEPGFAAAYPQYRLKYVSVGTGQAVTNAENGGGDALLTHSDVLEDDFVAKDYSYEPGGRLVMTSDFVTVGPAPDPAGLQAGPAHDVVVAYREVAAAGDAGRADFVSRGDASGTNTKEKAIWKLAGVPLDSAGEPGTPGTSTAAAWYHKTGKGQGDNLVVTDQCPFSSGACYTFTDRGTFNTVTANRAVTRLRVVSEQNTAAGAKGGVSLLTNPYHAYAVNPAKEAGVNLPGALAFLNYLTSPATQDAIAAFPSRAAPAFVPDAIPRVTVRGLPSRMRAGAPVTLTGTATPGYPLDPALTGATVQVLRAGDPSASLGSTTVRADGTWSVALRPERSDAYQVYLPPSRDGLVLPTGTSYRQATTVPAGTVQAVGATSLAVARQHRPFGHGRAPVRVRLTGTAVSLKDRGSPGIRVQVRRGNGTWRTASARLALTGNRTGWSITVSLPSAASWQVRAQYSDPGVVLTAYSRVVRVVVR